MKPRKIITIVGALCFLWASLQITPIQAQEEVSTFGVEINQVYSKHPYQDSLDKASRANNNWVRYNGLLWSKYQPNNSSEFKVDQKLEANMIATSEAGMEMILIIRSTPSWAQKYPGYFCGPMAEKNLNDFANFMVRVVETYSQPPYNVRYYELWNEQDECRNNENIHPAGEFGCWGENSDPTHFGGRYYGKMLKAVYPAVKAAVPEAQIVMGGLLLPCYPGTHTYCNMSNFLKGILVELAGDDGVVSEHEAMFDYANFHGYTAYNNKDFSSGILMETYESWWINYGGMVEGKLWYIRQMMDNFGLSKPVFLTEASLIDTNNIVNENNPAQVAAYENAKADYLVYVYVRNIHAGITGTTWYHMDNYGWRKGGMLDANNDPLPAYDAYQVMTTTLSGTGNDPVELSFEGGILGYEFKKGANKIWVLFSRNAGTKTIKKSDIPFSIQHMYNLFGKQVNHDSSKISFDRPIYIDNIPNTAPVFISEPVTSVYQDQSYHYDIVTASTGEENYDIHTINMLSGLPGWLNFTDHGDGTASLSGRPNNEEVGDYWIDLIVTDSHGLTDTQSFPIEVINVNDPPRFVSKPVTKAVAGEQYRYDIEVTDPDLIHGDILTISAVTKPVWLTLTNTGPTTATLSGTPNSAQVEEKPLIILKVVDQQGAEAIQAYALGELHIYLPLIIQ